MYHTADPRSFQSTKPSWFWELAGRHDDPAARASKVKVHDPSKCLQHIHRFEPEPFCMLPSLPQIYCSGDLLDAVQLSGIFEDSKEFVDMPMRYDPEIILDVSQIKKVLSVSLCLVPPIHRDI